MKAGPNLHKVPTRKEGIHLKYVSNRSKFQAVPANAHLQGWISVTGEKNCPLPFRNSHKPTVELESPWEGPRPETANAKPSIPQVLTSGSFDNAGGMREFANLEANFSNEQEKKCNGTTAVPSARTQTHVEIHLRLDINLCDGQWGTAGWCTPL